MNRELVETCKAAIKAVSTFDRFRRPGSLVHIGLPVSSLAASSDSVESLPNSHIDGAEVYAK